MGCSVAGFKNIRRPIWKASMVRVVVFGGLHDHTVA